MCLGCGGTSAREDLQRRFVVLNPDWSVQAGAVAPDGDVFLEDNQVLHFQVPSCEDCGGILKPEVTFFGDTVSKATVQFVHDRLAESDAVLVLGSSLQVRPTNVVELSALSGCQMSQQPLFSSRFTQDIVFYWRPVTGKFPWPSLTLVRRGPTTWLS